MSSNATLSAQVWPEDWPDGYGRRILDEVDSTNAEAARIGPGLAGPEWILARRQTAARGRRGRVWAMPPGNFAATLVMTPNEPTERVALRSFVAALALFDAFVAATGQAAPFSLKWPNDVLLNGAKVAGILLESSGAGGTIGHFAIGFGVNLASAPDLGAMEAGALPPTALASTGTLIDPEAFLTLLAQAYARHEAAYVTHGFAPVRTAWLARAARIGEQITARTMKSETTGRFDTIDAAGNLVLVTPERREVIAAADIFF